MGFWRLYAKVGINSINTKKVSLLKYSRDYTVFNWRFYRRDNTKFKLTENKETNKELCDTEKNNKGVLYSEDIDGERITVYEKELEPDYDLEKQLTNLQKENKQ